MVLERQYVSVDKFLEIVEQPEYDDRVVELIEGIIVDMPLPNGEHGEILSLLHAKIAGYVYEKGIGRVTVGDAGFALAQNPDGRDTVRGLDLAFISIEKAPNPLPSGLITTPPDLAVEIISPSNKAGDIEKKIQQLLAAGTRVIWTVYPGLRSVSVHTPDGAMTLKETDTLTGGGVLPGFELRVADLFPS